MYVVVIIETESDTPGIARVFGPYSTYEMANDMRRITREVVETGELTSDPELVQVARVENV